MYNVEYDTSIRSLFLAVTSVLATHLKTYVINKWRICKITLFLMVRCSEFCSESCIFQSLQKATWFTIYDNKRKSFLHWYRIPTVCWFCKHFDQIGFIICCYVVKAFAISVTFHEVSFLGIFVPILYSFGACDLFS